MISRLPKWIEVGALLLALIAGFVNAIGLLSFEHQAVSHLSGTATLLGASFLNDTLPQSVHLLGVLLSFLAGAAIAGYLVHGATLKLGRHYDTALLLEAFLLVGSFLLLNNNLSGGHFFASAACGLQNALATTYSGAIVRTTHVTGLFTDLGLMLGGLLKGDSLDKRKARLFVLIILGFILGGTLGAGLFSFYQFYALLFPAGLCVVLAWSYRLYSRCQGQ